MSRILPVPTNAAAESAAMSPNAVAGVNAGDFSRVFREALAQNLAEQSLAGMSGQGLSLPANQALGDIQSTLLAQSVSGQAGNGQMLMFMMMVMMMREFGDSDLAPMMGALFAALPNASGTDGNVISAGAAKAGIRPSALAYKGASTGFLPTQAWLPTALRLSSNAATRSASSLRNVIDQFNVESAERYRPYRNGNTYCNIFVWDVTRALGCEIPHYVDRASGEPRKWPDTEGAYELDANGTHDWLVKHGEKYGWQEVSAEEAQLYANAGYPAVTAWKSGGGTAGHVQVVCPSLNGGYDAARGVTVAQAGSRNFSYAHINATMSKDKLPGVRYFIHA